MKRNNSPGRYFQNNSSNSGGYNGNKNNKSNYHSKHEQSKKSPAKPFVKLENTKDKISSTDNRNNRDKIEQDSKIPQHEKKFTQRCRLFVGNLPPDITEQDFKNLFTKFGEISETFVNAEKGYGFVRMDTRANAEKAKYQLDGKNMKHNRTLRIRFATHGAALSVKNLSSFVSNELLEEAFQMFGTVERAVVIVDDRGRSTGRGIVEFSRKASASKAIQQIKDGCFLLSSSPRAILATPLEQEDTEDGLPERNLLQNTPQYFQEREAPPRFAKQGTFEEEFARRWKALDDLERQQRDELERNIQAAKEKLESEMENAIHEHKTMLMKQDLLRRQDELNRLEDARKRELDRRQQLELAREDARQKEFEEMQQQQQLLRAQIEGNFKPDGFPRNSRPGFMHAGGPPVPPNPQLNLLHEALTAQEMMGGRVGLGPAPSRFDQGMPPMGSRGTPPLGGGQGPRGFGGGPKPGQRRGFVDPNFDQQKRRRF